MFKMKKCYDRENASSDINECLKLYQEHEESADSFSEGTLYMYDFTLLWFCHHSLSLRSEAV